MSRIGELLGDGVEVRALGDVARLVRGNGMPKTMLTNEGIGAIHYGQIYTRYGTWTTSTHSFVAPEDAAKFAQVDPGDIIITNTSENLADVGKAVAWLGGSSIVTGGHATVIKHQLDPKYLSYWFQSPAFQTQKVKLASGTKVIDVSARQLGRVQIPVPSLAVQREIASILDRFASLETELESQLLAELTARRRQYVHYRDTLLSFAENAGGGVARVCLSEIGTFIRGRRFTWSDVVDMGIPAIHYSEIYTRYGVAASVALSHVRRELAPTLRMAEPGDVIMAAVGETVDDLGKAVAWVGSSPVAIHDDTFLFRSHLDPRYVAYCTQTADFQAQKNRYVARAKVKRISGAGLGQIAIPVPLLAEQRRVVASLDSFDALVREISIGLPAELAARRKQYEYYRDKLLTFEELAP